MEVAAEEQAGMQQELMERYSCVPVFIPDGVAELYYNGFSNRYGGGAGVPVARCGRCSTTCRARLRLMKCSGTRTIAQT